MEFAKQAVTLPIENFDDVDNEKNKKNITRHGNLLPNTIRAVFAGPSGCGKTNALLALLTHANGVRFENLYVYSKSLDQAKYKFLERLLQPLNGMGFFSFSEHENVISPDQALPDSIMIFDDIACEKQDNVRAFFCMGRHKSVDCFYLCQSYARIPKHLVRDNVNFLAVFKQDDVNLKHIYDDHVNTDMTFTRFKDLCSNCWNDAKHGFLLIDKERPLERGRFRKTYDSFAINITRL